MSNFIGQIKNFFERQAENFRVLLATMVLNTSIKTMTTSRAWRFVSPTLSQKLGGKPTTIRLFE